MLQALYIARIVASTVMRFVKLLQSFIKICGKVLKPASALFSCTSAKNPAKNAAYDLTADLAADTAARGPGDAFTDGLEHTVWRPCGLAGGFLVSGLLFDLSFGG